MTMTQTEDECSSTGRRKWRRQRGSHLSTSPMGALIVLDEREIATERNQSAELFDATANAENMARRRVCKGFCDL